MRLALPGTIDPFTGIPFRFGTYMVVMDVSDEVVHIAQVMEGATIPATDCDLVRGLARVVVVLHLADESVKAR